MIITTALGRKVEVAANYTIDQPRDTYTRDEHDRWDRLYNRQVKILENRACDEVLDGLQVLNLAKGGIPNFADISEKLMALTGWSIAPVPDLVPDEVFFEHLANRRFPAACFIRSEDQLDYIEEPDIFHDIFGHVPLLSQPVFADFLARFGQLGLEAMKNNTLKYLARVYWFTVEFGLIETAGGLRIYGAGIASSKGESVFSLEDSAPGRLPFDLLQVLRTPYQNNRVQDRYFVVSDFEQLFLALENSFADVVSEAKRLGDLEHIYS
ncbi:MAG: phenylalanine 4-monooxygenase [Sphingomonadales bacterium]|nr:phenylalanine 4-monooxygenase [Sphingomonadales bacterium]